MPRDKIERIGKALVANGVSEKLVRRIIGDRRLPYHEKVFLLSDIVAKLASEPRR